VLAQPMTANRDTLEKLGRYLLRNDWTGSIRAGAAPQLGSRALIRSSAVVRTMQAQRHHLHDPGPSTSDWIITRAST
jgi:hypothetical protein